MNKRLMETITLLAIGIAVSIANFWHIILQWRLNPPGKYYTWIAHYYADYFLYVSQIAEGVRGSWIWSKSLYTNEIMPDIWVYWPNVLMGKVGSLLTGSPFIIYTVSLVLMVAALLCLLSYITAVIFPRHPVTRLVAFFFCVTASNFINVPDFIQTGAINLVNEMWFSPTPALNRLGGVPHQTLQTVLLLTVAVLFAFIMDAKKTSWFANFLFILACFLTATVSPIQMLIVAMGISMLLFLRKPNKIMYPVIVVGLAVAALGAVLVNRAFDSSTLYSAAKAWEAAQMITGNRLAILLAFGPVILFIPFGMSRFIQDKGTLGNILLLYGTLSLILFISPLPALLGTSPTRWIHPASLIVWYLIAAAGWRTIALTLSQRLTTQVDRQKKLKHYLSYLFLIGYLVLTVPALLGQIISRSSPTAAPALYSDINHVPENVMQVMDRVKQSDNTVLMDPTLPYDVLIPILTGNKSFTGHPVHTLYPQTKEELRRRFFNGAMDEPEARQFFRDHMIQAVISSPNAIPVITRYPFLTESFTNNTAILYEVSR